jgi:hypothetical protein
VYDDIVLRAEIEGWDPKPGSMNLFKMLDQCKLIMDEVKAWTAWGNGSDPDAATPKAWNAE